MATPKTPIEQCFDYRSQIMGFAALWILCSHCIGILGEKLWPYLIYFKPFITFGWGGRHLPFSIWAWHWSFLKEKPFCRAVLFKTF